MVSSGKVTQHHGIGELSSVTVNLAPRAGTFRLSEMSASPSVLVSNKIPDGKQCEEGRKGLFGLTVRGHSPSCPGEGRTIGASVAVVAGT